MKKRIFRSILAVAVTVLAASLVLTVGVLHGYFQDRILAELIRSTAYIAQGVEEGGLSYLESGLPRDSRVTWVAADGTVLYDNWEDPAGMENHAGREEIQEAMRLGRGTASRYSDTLSQKTVYYAMRLSDGSVLRTSDTQYAVWMMVLQVLQPVALMALMAALLALWLSGRVARQLVEPINAIDLSGPDADSAYEELSPLLSRIRGQSRQIQRQLLDLQQRREEFTAITENMSEGLILIDQETRILSCNSAAVRLLAADGPAAEGESVLTLNREAGFRRCVEESLAGRPWEALLERDDDCRRIMASPVEREGSPAGAVLIVLDVTEKERRDRLRREFTANVSHELKTPLTSILGTAEILENGLVRSQDISHFAGNIHREAQRLIDLVNDIIKLSRLDEGGHMAQWETVDLYALAQAVEKQLSAAAEAKQVTMTLAGGPAQVRGVPQILEEVLYNLCDNAVAYNRPGGSVTVTVSAGAAEVRVQVRDTGVGIPPDARQRVFERFYRVDKSHSTPGTGLGLSIVKHGTAYLGGRVELESEVGVGSTFTLIFPAAPENT